MKYAIVLKATGSIEIQKVSENDPLRVMQKAVDGYIELIPGYIDYKQNIYRMVCNEDGIYKGLDWNIWASWLADGKIFGDVIIAKEYKQDLVFYDKDEAEGLLQIIEMVLDKWYEERKEVI